VDLDRKQALFVLTAGRFGPLFLSAPVRHKFIPADRLPPNPVESSCFQFVGFSSKIPLTQDWSFDLRIRTNHGGESSQWSCPKQKFYQ